MGEATLHELRTNSAELLSWVAAGEAVTITQDGRPVAELLPLPKQRLTAGALASRFSRLPPVDPERFRRDVDGAVDLSQ